MTVPLPLFELIEADGDVNQITDIAKADTLSVELERKRKNGSSLFIGLELMRYLLMLLLVLREKSGRSMMIKLSSHKSTTLNSSF